MPVYSYKMVSRLHESLAGMAFEYFRRMPLILTPDEFLTCFINPEHLDKLREAEELVGFLGNHGFRTVHRMPTPDEIPDGGGVSELPLEVAFAGRPPVILPSYLNIQGLFAECPTELREKVDAWAMERFRQGYAFGLVKDAITELNDQCSDAETLTLFLPCFPLIMSKITNDAESKTGIRAQKLATNKKAGKMPRLPREVTNKIQWASSIVSAYTLVEESPEPSIPKKHARIAAYTNRGTVPVKNIFHEEVYQSSFF